MYKFKFTVFTPTYNRATLLHRLYDSLKDQSFRDFEWLIVDDGSSDNTESVVSKFKDQEKLNIRYIKKPNGGKHTATNLGVKEAKGELFCIVDSDDYLAPDALNDFNDEWERIENKELFCSVCGLCSYINGDVIGTRFPEDMIDSNSMEIRAKYKVTGDKTAVTKTDVYKEFPFPVFDGEKFLAESVVYDLFALNYKTRYVNKVFKYKEYQDGGLSDNVLRLRINSPRGTLHYYNQSMQISSSLKKRARSAVNYIRYSFHIKFGVFKAISEANVKILTLMAIIPAIIIYQRDKARELR